MTAWTANAARAMSSASCCTIVGMTTTGLSPGAMTSDVLVFGIFFVMPISMFAACYVALAEVVDDSSVRVSHRKAAASTPRAGAPRAALPAQRRSQDRHIPIRQAATGICVQRIVEAAGGFRTGAGGRQLAMMSGTRHQRRGPFETARPAHRCGTVDRQRIIAPVIGLISVLIADFPAGSCPGAVASPSRW
jgi:hypothetical protein